MTGTTGSCRGHAGLSTELRTLVLGALDRFAPALDRVRAGPATAAAETCAVCPVCAAIAVLRGERPELAVRLAEQVAGLVAALRAALEEGGPAAPGPEQSPASPPQRTVQHIKIDRQQDAR